MIDADEGPHYLRLVTVLDLFSRRLLGYATSAHHGADSAVASLQMAATTPCTVDGAIFHSDRGREYTAQTYAHTCQTLDVAQSMGRVGSALDNAAVED